MNIIPLMAVSQVWGKVWPILLAILFFGVLIFVHECGHFLFAKLFKVRVNEFAMGMGPTLFKRVKGETTYALRLLPVGGFVSMEGEDESSEDERAFCNKPVWQRIIIVAAGAIVNLILGVIIVAVMLAARSDIPNTPGREDLIGTPEIVSFAEDSAIAQSGLQKGDIIKRINGKKVYSEIDLGFLLSRDHDGKVNFTVKRGDKVIDLQEAAFVSSDFSSLVIRGVDPSFSTVTKTAACETVSLSRMVWISLFDLVTGQYGIKDVSGPIGTVAYVSEAAQTASEETNYENLYLMMALIAINIGIFNLLPLPALDGGRLFFMFIELIFRKPVPQKLEGWVHAVGLVLLLGFMAVISLSDIITLVQK